MEHAELLDKIWNAVKDNDLELMKVLTKDLPNDGRQLLGGFNYQIDKEITVRGSIFPRQSLGLMHVAAFYDSFEIFLYLLNKGFSVEVKTANEFQPIHYAAIGGATEIASFLCIHNSPSIHNAPGDTGLSPLYLAACAKCPDIIRYLTDAGVAVKDSRHGRHIISPIQCAIDNKDIHSLTILLERSSISGNTLANDYSPLMRAIANNGNLVDAVELLLKNGANPNYQTPNGKNALYLACMRGPVHWAAASSNTDILRLILKEGADPTVVDSRKRTALFSVVASDKDTWYDKFEILLNYNLPINDRADNDMLLLSHVLMSDNDVPVPPQVVTLLLEHGADLTIEVRRTGKSIWEIAEPFVSEAVKDAVEAFMVAHPDRNATDVV